MIEVEVVYATPRQQQLCRLQLAEGARVADALAAAGFGGAQDAELAATTQVGIFGRIVDRGQPLKHGDRVEIYRPLLADPKLARRRRAALARRR